MKFTPKNYTVSYKGVFHKPGVPFDIDDTDADEMIRHGSVEKTPVTRNEKIVEAVRSGIEATVGDTPPKKPGRPRKVSE